LLWGESFSLEDGVMAIIPVAELMHPGHARIEGRGIVPDREVQLNRADLLQGVDSQLHAAMDWLQQDG
jgi:C-terminal processing protease CtpA/Prc